MSNPFDQFNTDSKLFFPVAEREVNWTDKHGVHHKAPNHKALIRVDNQGKPLMLNIVGSEYKVVPNKELFGAIEQAMLNEMLPEHFKDMRVTDRIASWGQVCYREYIFPAIQCQLAYNAGVIGFRIIAQNGYGGSAMRIHSGAIDFYCTNGMISGEFISTYRKHTSGLVLEGITNIIRDALAKYAMQQDVWKLWYHKPVKFEAVATLIEAVSRSKKMKEGLHEQFEREADVRGQTLWAVYSALTHYASHADGKFALRSSVEEANTEASTMLHRELNVAKWIKLPEFKAMENV